MKIAPAEIITFTKVGSELIGTVDIFNVINFPITYKVCEERLFSFTFLHLIWSWLWFCGFAFHKQIKTTSPEKFRVRPSTGILTPGSSTTISVVLQSGPNVTLLLNKDKFLVMCMEINDLNASQQDIADIWKVWIIKKEEKKLLSQREMKELIKI